MQETGRAVSCYEERFLKACIHSIMQQMPGAGSPAKSKSFGVPRKMQHSEGAFRNFLCSVLVKEIVSVLGKHCSSKPFLRIHFSAKTSSNCNAKSVLNINQWFSGQQNTNRVITFYR